MCCVFQNSHSGETPRGSWATFDLRNSNPDPAVPGLLDHVDALVTDQLNEVRRAENRPEQVLALFPSEQEVVERRLQPEEPTEQPKHRILVQCNKLE